MVRALFVFGLVSFTFSLSAPVHARTHARSAKRDPGVSYLAYKSTASLYSQGSEVGEANAQDLATRYSADAVRPVTEWKSVAEMNRNFQEFRDKRFLISDSHPEFMRRSTWLYPDDGCFARAALAVLNLSQAGVSAPDKIFVFGNLTVRSENTESGSVSWWYHVAPIVQVQGLKYVLDPAVEPREPLKLEDWLGRMAGNIHEVEVAVCRSGSYTPDDPCNRLTDGIEARALEDQLLYLNFEWSRVEDLHRDPREELGANPPWLVQHFAF